MEKIVSFVMIGILCMSTFSVFSNLGFNLQLARAAATPIQLTTNPFWDVWPSWHPSGNEIVYTAFSDSSDRSIWVLNFLNPSEKRALTNEHVDEAPSYSSDGQKIVFVRYGLRGDYLDIVIMNADGSNVKRVTYAGLPGLAEGCYTSPQFVNGDQEILFEYFPYSSAGGPDNYIGIMNVDGSNVRVIGNGTCPHWCTYNSKIVYQYPNDWSGTFQGNATSIYVMNSDGTGIIKLTVGPSDHEPHMSSTGRIAFSRNGDVYIMNADGTDLRKLTTDGRMPHWSPDGKSIVYFNHLSENRDLWALQSVNNLADYWKFDEGSGTVASDSSGNGNTGTVNGAQWIGGRIGTALNFDGIDDSVDVPSNPLFSGFNQLTLQAWIKADRLDMSKGYIVAKSDGYDHPDINDEYGLFLAGCDLSFHVADGGLGYLVFGTATGVIDQIGSWYFIAAVWMENTYTIYVNGKTVATGTASSGTSSIGSAPVTIGQIGHWSWTYFDGTIDEVKIYNYARTEEEVWSEYASQCFSPPATEWNMTYGGTEFDAAYSLVKTSDGGYAIAGHTGSFGAGGSDFWLVKTDVNGNTQWNKTYGGSGDDYAFSVLQTSDGGYAVAGQTSSTADGCWDMLLVRTDADGQMMWNKTYGNLGSDEQLRSVVKTSDGGYALAGALDNPYDVDVDDFLLVKTDADGQMMWNRTYGGSHWELAFCVVQTEPDAGYALVGSTKSFGNGGSDFWFVKTDSAGNIQWNKTYGGTEDEFAYSVVQMADGGYAMAGKTNSYGAGNYDAWLVKTDVSGTMQWNRTCGETQIDETHSVIQTQEGGYALVGSTTSFGTGDLNGWLAKTDPDGNMEWNQTYGGTADDELWSLVQIDENGFAMAGYTKSFGQGNGDFWLTTTSYGPPEIGILSPESTTYYSFDVLLTVDLSEPTSWIGYSLDNQANVTIYGNITIYAEEGPHQIIIYTNDTFGYMGSSVTVSFSVEIHDIAVRSVNTSKTGCIPLPVVCRNYTVNITAVVENLGIYNETLSLSIYANTTLVETRSMTLTGMNVSAQTFTWNTTEFPKGIYTIIAYAEPVLHETSTSDNTLEGDWIMVAWIGDINCDGIVDIKDVYKVGLAFGTSVFLPNPPGRTYNPNSDINNDGKVDVKDYYVVCKHYGEVDP